MMHTSLFNPSWLIPILGWRIPIIFLYVLYKMEKADALLTWNLSDSFALSLNAVIIIINTWINKKFENFKSRKNFNRVPSQGQCQLQIDTCHLLLQWLNHELLELLTFNTAPHKEFRVESRNEGKTGRTGLQVDIFRSWFYDPNYYISSYLGKHQNPTWWWLFLVTSKSITRLGENFWEK